MKLIGELPRGHHRHRPGADRDPDAPEEGRGRQVRRVLRPRPARARPGRPRHHRQHGARVWRHDGFFPVDAETLRYLRADRPRRRPCRAGRALLQGAGPVPHRRDARARRSRRRSSSTSAPSTPSLAGPKRPQDRVPLTELKRNFIVNLPGLMSANVAARRGRSRPERVLALDGRGRRQRHDGDRGAKRSPRWPPPIRRADRASIDGEDITCATARWSSRRSPAAPTRPTRR